jgi:hypothetical protein
VSTWLALTLLNQAARSTIHVPAATAAAAAALSLLHLASYCRLTQQHLLHDTCVESSLILKTMQHATTVAAAAA